MNRSVTIIAILALFVAACGDDDIKKGSFTNAGTSNASTPNSTTPNSTTPNSTTPNSTTPNNVADGPCVRLDRATLEFPDTPVGGSASTLLTLTNCSETESVTLESVEVGGGAFDAVLTEEATAGPGASLEFEVTFAPTTSGAESGTLSIELVELSRPITANLEGTAIGGDCVETVARVRAAAGGAFDVAITASVSTMLELDGSTSSSPAGDVTDYAWSIVAQPNGSTATLSSNSSVAPLFTPDVPGNYRIQLVATDAPGNSSCQPAEVSITAVAGQASSIHLQLVWNTPADPDETDDFGTDLDLHWKHQLGVWDTEPYDCFWKNPSPDWGPNGPAGNPSSDVDDNNGAGPENINHDGLEPGITYSVGVYYYNDNGYAASYATVRIFSQGQLIFELEDRFLAQEFAFWHVANVVAPATVTSVDMISDGFP